MDISQFPPAAQSIISKMSHPETISENSLLGLSILRDPAQFKWQIITLFLLVLYVYSNELSKKNYSVVLGGLAFWGWDWFNETWNALWFFFTQKAPVWGAPANDTGCLIMIGLNIEITLMFAVLGICAAKLLLPDKNAKILGINNRWALAVGGSIMAVIIEMALNWCGALTWEWTYWKTGFPFILFLIGYLPFFVACYVVHDLPTLKKQIIAVSCILGFDFVTYMIFAVGLGWI